MGQKASAEFQVRNHGGLAQGGSNGNREKKQAVTGYVLKGELTKIAN